MQGPTAWELQSCGSFTCCLTAVLSANEKSDIEMATLLYMTLLYMNHMTEFDILLTEHVKSST